MLRASHVLMLTVVALLALAVVMVHSAGMSLSGEPFSPMRLLTSRHMAYAVIAVAGMLFASRLNIEQLIRYRGWCHPVLILLPLAVGLVVMAMVPGIGEPRNGAWRWLEIGAGSHRLTFQPSELLKWVLVLTLAWWCTRRRGGMHRFKGGLIPAVLLVGVCCGLVIIQDLGTGVLMGAVAAVMLLAGGVRLWQLAMALPPAAAGIIYAIIHSPYRMERLMAFMNPWQDPQGIGYHPIQSLLAFAGGGLTGRGLGNGIQKFGYLPEDTTDFLFAIICEELGLAGAVLVVGLYLLLLWVGLGVVRRTTHTFGKLLGLGILLTIGIQAVMNLAVVTVVVPTKGIALPLLSAGGTGWVLGAFCVGLLASLDEAEYLRAAEPPTPPRPVRTFTSQTLVP